MAVERASEHFGAGTEPEGDRTATAAVTYQVSGAGRTGGAAGFFVGKTSAADGGLGCGEKWGCRCKHTGLAGNGNTAGIRSGNRFARQVQPVTTEAAGSRVSDYDAPHRNGWMVDDPVFQGTGRGL